jgi:hypothetical protein
MSRVIDFATEAWISVWDVRLGNAFDLVPLGRTVDFAYAFRLIRDFERGDRERLYRQFRERLNLRDILVFDVVNRPMRQPIDARNSASPRKALPVDDATHTADAFRAEMDDAGFEVR